MPILPGDQGIAPDILNFYSHGGNVLIGDQGQIMCPVIINNSGKSTKVHLNIRGLKTGATVNKTNHGVGEHLHGVITTGGGNTALTGTNIIPDTRVPMNVKIFINGIDFTYAIGDANSKGSTMYYPDTLNADWGSYGTAIHSWVLADTWSNLNDIVQKWTCQIQGSDASEGGTAYMSIDYSDGTTQSTNTIYKAGVGYIWATMSNPSPAKIVNTVRLYIKKISDPSYMNIRYIRSNAGWGVNATTEWDTGDLDITEIELYQKDFAITNLLNGDITATATTIPIDDGTGLTAPGTIRIGYEYITYTGISTNNLTGCTRGAFDSTASLHFDDSSIYYIPWIAGIPEITIVESHYLDSIDISSTVGGTLTYQVSVNTGYES